MDLDAEFLIIPFVVTDGGVSAVGGFDGSDGPEKVPCPGMSVVPETGETASRPRTPLLEAPREKRCEKRT